MDSGLLGALLAIRPPTTDGQKGVVQLDSRVGSFPALRLRCQHALDLDSHAADPWEGHRDAVSLRASVALTIGRGP